MSSFNKVILIGNMTADAELKQTTGGVSVCSFTIAVNRRFTKDGEQSCDFITVQAWRQSAEFVARFFTKGKPILVCGQLQVRSWTDKDGNKRYATEVVADEVSFVGNAEHEKPTVSQPPMPNAYAPKPQQTQFEEIPNDEGLPF